MPIQRCELPDGGGQGWRWGASGTCYRDRKDAEKQAEAAYANGYTGDDEFSLTQDAWNEGDHPRAANGEFGSGGGGYKYVGHTQPAPKKTAKEWDDAAWEQAKNRQNAGPRPGDHPIARPASGGLDPAKLAAAHAASERAVEMVHGRSEESPAHKNAPAQPGEKQPHPFVGQLLKTHGNNTAKHLESVPAGKLHTALKIIGNDPVDADSKKVKKLIENELDSRADRGASKGFGEDHALHSGDCIAIDRAAVSALPKDINRHLHVADLPISRAEINE